MKDAQAYLRQILDRIERIERFTHEGRDQFMDSELVQDAVLRNFQVIGGAAKRLPAEFREQFPDVPWRRLTGFRDVVVHDYDELISQEIWGTVQQDLPDLKAKITQILAMLDS